MYLTHMLLTNDVVFTMLMLFHLGLNTYYIYNHTISWFKYNIIPTLGLNGC
jgi:hypothetical protein